MASVDRELRTGRCPRQQPLDFEMDFEAASIASQKRRKKRQEVAL
jgi:hypothetical protein